MVKFQNSNAPFPLTLSWFPSKARTMPAAATSTFTQYKRATQFQDLIPYVGQTPNLLLACNTCLTAVPLAAIVINFSRHRTHGFQQRDPEQLLIAWVELRLPTQPVLFVAIDDLKI
jgi:hypothetical protein